MSRMQRTLRSPAAPKADDPSQQPQFTTKAPPPPPPLPQGVEDDEARALIVRIRALSNNRLNTAQAQAISALLQSPTAAAYLTPSGTIPGYIAQVSSAAVRSDGTIQITFTMGTLTLDPQGNVVGPIPQIAPGTASNTTPGTPNLVYTQTGVSRGSCTVVMLDAGIGILLAVFLLVIGILALRQTPGTRRLFLIYATIKIVIAIAAIGAFASIVSALDTAKTPAGAVPLSAPGAPGGGAALVGLHPRPAAHDAVRSGGAAAGPHPLVLAGGPGAALRDQWRPPDPLR
jgi:hypothetical protein